MRDHLQLFLNGKAISVSGASVFETLSDFLRREKGMIGTKIVCSEGDCGACSVLLGRLKNDRIVYQAVDSCILFMHQLDGAHVVTVEGLTNGKGLNPIQQAMIDCHGSQCGFCTPGFVVMMTALFENRNDSSNPLTEQELRRGLTGNLCRCTGYVQIFESGMKIDPESVTTMNELYPEKDLVPKMQNLHQESVLCEAHTRGENREVFIPATVDEAVAFKSVNENVTIVSGATDLGVQYNKGITDPVCAMPLAKLDEIKSIQRHNGMLSIGAACKWNDVEVFIQNSIPQFHQILGWFGSPQIRHVGTIGGNLINASPISDSIPFLMVSDAELEVAGPKGSRRININEFYKGYKQFDLNKDEMLVRIHLPVTNDSLKLYKISRRRDMDISTFTGAFIVKHDHEKIESARIAYGGCGPVVFRLSKTEEFLNGKPFTEETFVEAGQIARTEITPITDVRGTEDFRLQLAENIPVKFFHEVSEDMAAKV